MPTYFITFTTYGQWLHGDGGSVDRDHNQPGEPLLPPDRGLWNYRRKLMTSEPYRLDEARRSVVLAAILEHARYKGWNVHAVRVRSTHVHAVVSGDAEPERIMNAFKAYASRALTAAGFGDSEDRRWSRHGSTRWLDTDASVRGAIRYAVDEQGEPMAVFEQAACEG